MPPWKKINALVELTRPYNFTSVLLIFLLGYYFSPHATDLKLLYGMLLLALLHSAATVQNDLEDLHIDKVNKLGRPLETSITLREAKILFYGLLIAAIIVGFIQLSINIIFIPLVLTLTWLYNAKPFLLSRKPILSIITLGLISSLAPLVYGFILGGNQVGYLALLWICSWFFIRISMTLLKDYKDEKGDRQFHKQTFYIQYGKRITALTSILLASAGYISLFIVSFFITNSLFLVIPLVFALLSFYPRIALVHIGDNKKANIIFHTIIARENQFELVYLLWIIFSR